jgi:hypothetical protein
MARTSTSPRKMPERYGINCFVWGSFDEWRDGKTLTPSRFWSMLRIWQS